MASWMVHLRIADKLLNEISNLSSTEFVIGNIAPDSCIPNYDWSAFTPSSDVFHFKTTDVDGLKDIHLNKYVQQFFTVVKEFGERIYIFKREMNKFVDESAEKINRILKEEYL